MSMHGGRTSLTDQLGERSLNWGLVVTFKFVGAQVQISLVVLLALDLCCFTSFEDFSSFWGCNLDSKWW